MKKFHKFFERQVSQQKFYRRQRIPESSCATKETADILMIYRNRDRKIIQSIRIMNESLENKKAEPVQPVQMNI